jgi:hypothetical protein
MCPIEKEAPMTSELPRKYELVDHLINEPVPTKFFELLDELQRRLVTDEIVEAAAAAYDAADIHPGPTAYPTHKECMRAALLAVALLILKQADAMRAERSLEVERP